MSFQVIEQKRQVERTLRELEEAQEREAMERERLARQEEETRQRLLKKMEEKLRHKVMPHFISGGPYSF